MLGHVPAITALPPRAGVTVLVLLMVLVVVVVVVVAAAVDECWKGFHHHARGAVQGAVVEALGHRRS